MSGRTGAACGLRTDRIGTQPVRLSMAGTMEDPLPLTSESLRKLGFLTIGLFDATDPRQGHESTLAIIELGERLGFDSAWVRHRHLQYGISSPIAVLAATSQRTSRIELGTAVIPLGWENPLRLAEDLATVDILTGGRLNPGVSVGPPMHYERVKHALYPDTSDVEDFSYNRVKRLLDFVRGVPATDFSGTEGFEVFSDHVQPHAQGLGRRMWYGGASLRSARWAGEHGMNFLTSTVVKAEESEDFTRSSSRTSGPSAPTTPTATAPASRRDSSSSPPTAPRPSNARNTRSTRGSGCPVPPRHRDRRG
jgi:alkanesulfonate monooxygenase SsuD/methylene tetrahydromethanopterin reductase-like flavin-dependent oxidoreductase (luciferase family)